MYISITGFKKVKFMMVHYIVNKNIVYNIFNANKNKEVNFKIKKTTKLTKTKLSVNRLNQLIINKVVDY